MEKRMRDLVETDLQTRVDSIKDVFISDNDLWMIIFLFFYVTDYEEFIGALDWPAAETKEMNRNETIGFFKRGSSLLNNREISSASFRIS